MRRSCGALASCPCVAARRPWLAGWSRPARGYARIPEREQQQQAAKKKTAAQAKCQPAIMIAATPKMLV